VARYRGHLSGPLLDRIDLHVEVPRVALDDMQQETGVEPSEAVRRRVVEARAVQKERHRDTPFRLNADLDGPAVRRSCTATPGALRLLRCAMQALGLSARAHDRILKVGRTLADLAGEESVRAEQMAEAIAFRALDRSEAQAP
jgi:magnesium chelatase family protein